MWQGDGTYAFARSLETLFNQLRAAYPSTAWQTNPGTGSIGDTAHMDAAQNDHQPWFNDTVRALDIDSTDPDGPDGPALFALGNAMYGAGDPRIFPDGYVIHQGRITDWDHPGGTHAYTGFDQHLTHVHISTSTNTGPAGFNSTAPWPLTGLTPQGGGIAYTPDSTDWFDMATKADLQAVVAAEVNRAMTAIIYGDGRGIDAAHNTHPDNIARARADIAGLAGTLQIMIFGDGRAVNVGSDTHPWNLKVIRDLLNQVIAEQDKQAAT